MNSIKIILTTLAVAVAASASPKPEEEGNWSMDDEMFVFRKVI